MNRFLIPDDPDFPERYKVVIVHPLNGSQQDTRDQLREWCLNNCQGRFNITTHHMVFDNENDYYLAIFCHSVSI